MQLEDNNLLSVKDKVTKYFPNCKMWQNITIAQLLNHSSGIKDYYESFWNYIRYYTGNKAPNQIISRYKNEPLLFRPGCKYDYSNTNYIILGIIIEKITGMTYPEYVNVNIIKPLNLTQTGYKANPNLIKNCAKGYILNMIIENNGLNVSNFYSAGGLYSSAKDLLKFLKSLPRNRLVNKNTQIKNKRYSYGFGLALKQNINTGKVYYHTGNVPGFTSAIYDINDKDIQIIILSNNNSFHPEPMMLDIYNSIVK